MTEISANRISIKLLTSFFMITEKQHKCRDLIIDTTSERALYNYLIFIFFNLLFCSGLVARATHCPAKILRRNNNNNNNNNNSSDFTLASSLAGARLGHTARVALAL